ncbi:MAG: hypothetical protein DWI21_09095 [Planctomycetota bacterium]|nr:MAG: hypothetical protein DWI21_09095 [Planctomycetota bacterium]GDY09387.1 hypothetical protein LBMAG52_28730 [Planctomycetia bacterium]
MVNDQTNADPGLFDALMGDGRPLLKLTGLALIGSGLFAFFLGATGHFLPQDIAYLGMNADELCSLADSRVVYFMVHDRVSFGGAILGVGTLYLWLAEFPLQARQGWAWWALLISGVIGFASFLAYLGYGYLDSWHGMATLVLLPIFATGMFKSLALVRPLPSIRLALTTRSIGSWRSASELGRLLLLVTAFCLVAGGLIIMAVGMTSVFVPQDLDYMQLTMSDLQSANPRLVPLIAHDRAGFGGGVCCCGITMFLCVLCGTPSRSLWQALFITGTSGFGSAIGVHYPIGYTNWFHLAPAYLGAVMFFSGMALTFPRSSAAVPRTS